VGADSGIAQARTEQGILKRKSVKTKPLE
jgi:hypothetical protein